VPRTLLALCAVWSMLKLNSCPNKTNNNSKTSDTTLKSYLLRSWSFEGIIQLSCIKARVPELELKIMELQSFNFQW